MFYIFLQRVDLRKREHEAFQGTLDILRKFVTISSKKLMPDLFALVLPLLVAFVDLEWSRQSANVSDPDELVLSTDTLSDIIKTLIALEPSGKFLEVLNQCAKTVEHLNPILAHC